MLSQSLKVDGKTLRYWAQQIGQYFEKENADTYYVPFRVTDTGCRHPARGKLQYALNKARLDLHRARGASPIRRRRGSSSESSTSSHESSPRPYPESLKNQKAVTDEHIEDAVNWLNTSTKPDCVVEQKWITTTAYRMEKLHGINPYSIQQYINEFPCLRIQRGLLLVIISFFNNQLF